MSILSNTIITSGNVDLTKIPLGSIKFKLFGSSIWKIGGESVGTLDYSTFTEVILNSSGTLTINFAAYNFSYIWNGIELILTVQPTVNLCPSTGSGTMEYDFSVGAEYTGLFYDEHVLFEIPFVL